MPTVEVKIDSNLAAVLAAFRDLPVQIQGALRAGLRLGLEAIKGGVLRNITTVFSSTSAGGLRQTVNVFVEDGGLKGGIRVDKKYAAIQEFGTVSKGGTFPDIVPVNAKVLRFEIIGAIRIAPLNGPWRRLKKPQEIRNVIFTTRVALPPRPFFWPAIEENLQQLPNQMRSQVDAMLEGKGL